MKRLRIRSYVSEEFAFPPYIELQGRIGSLLQKIYGHNTYMFDIYGRLETVDLISELVVKRIQYD